MERISQLKILNKIAKNQEIPKEIAQGIVLIQQYTKYSADNHRHCHFKPKIG